LVSTTTNNNTNNTNTDNDNDNNNNGLGLATPGDAQNGLEAFSASGNCSRPQGRRAHLVFEQPCRRAQPAQGPRAELLANKGLLSLKGQGGIILKATYIWQMATKWGR
jgi:hypothetical protein